MTSTIQQISTSLRSKQRRERFERIKNFLDYDAIIEYLDLDMTDWRGELWCSCPLPFDAHKHGDRNVSFSINVEDPDKIGLYNCFVCGGGTIINLISYLKEMSYEDAEKEVRRFVAGNEDLFPKMIERLLDSKEEKELNIDMPEMNEDTLCKFRFIHPWMHSQGMTDDAVKHLQIGWDEEENGIIFPHWWRGKLVGFQIRDLTGKPGQKYKNTHKFPKRNTLYHLDCECLRNSDSVIVVESPKTVAVLWSLGFHNVVATFGASLNPEQLASLWHFTGPVFLWFDNDEAGAKAYRTATKYLRGMVDLMIVPPVDLEKGDPGDLKTSDEVQDYLDRAKSVVEMEL